MKEINISNATDLQKAFKNCPINFLCAGFEILQHKITSDLNTLGAKNIRNLGFGD